MTGRFAKYKASLIRAGVAFFLAVATLVSVALASANPQGVHDFYMPFLRAVMRGLSVLTGVFPFSVFEILFTAFVLFTACAIVFFIIKLVKIKGARLLIAASFMSKSALVAVSLVFFMVMSWGLGYCNVTLAKSLGLDVRSRTVTELADAAKAICAEAGRLSSQVERNTDGTVKSPGLKNIIKQLSTDAGENGKTVARAKPLISSKFFSYMGITGIFIPFTGEANFNRDDQTVSVPFTIAHELSHRDGVNREDEANFAAFRICAGSENLLVRYSAYYSAAQYLMRALYKEDKGEYAQIRDSLDENLTFDMQQYIIHWQEYEGPVKQAASTVNDHYIKSTGQPEGEKTYGRMVDLLIAYLEAEHE